MIKPEVFHHVEQRIAQSRVILDPTPHIYVENVFPADFYSQLLNALPADADYATYDPPYQERLYMNLTVGALSHLQGNVAKLWCGITEWLASQRLLDVTTAKFAPWILDTYPHREALIAQHVTKDGAVPVAPRSLLARDHKHFQLGPHTDAPAKIVTGIFYLPRTSEMQEFGTAFFRPRDPTYKSWRTVHHEFDSFEPVKVCPYLPNTMVGFVKTDSSFHGVLHRDYPDRTRDLFFYLPEIGVRADNPVTLEMPVTLFGAPRTISPQASASSPLR